MMATKMYVHARKLRIDSANLALLQINSPAVTAIRKQHDTVICICECLACSRCSDQVGHNADVMETTLLLVGVRQHTGKPSMLH